MIVLKHFQLVGIKLPIYFCLTANNKYVKWLYQFDRNSQRIRITQSQK